MKRTRRSFNSTLPPSKGPTRKTKLKVRGKSRFPKRRNDAYRKWIRTLLCGSLTGWIDGGSDHGGPIECAHVKSRGAGGDDYGNCIPLCRRHHRLQHDKGWGSVFRDGQGHARLIAGGLALQYELHQLKNLSRRWREQQGETAA